MASICDLFIINKYPFIKGPLGIYREMAFCFQNCSGDREKLLKFEAESQKFAAILRSLEQFIWTGKSQNIFETECFFNLFLEISKIQYIIHNSNYKK